jgi:hypothetical protein
MRKLLYLIIAAVLTLGPAGYVSGQSLEKQPDGSVTWQAGVDGATLEFNPDGTVKRIYSKFSQPVTIADKRGIQTATVIAEEKAKANIVRFLNQHVASSRIVNEFESAASTTMQEKSGATKAISTTDQRSINQSLNQLTSSFSSGTLTGVVVLESGYDDKEREAWVVVGLSQKTMAGAKATQEMLSSSPKPGPSGSSISTPADEHPKSVIRRGNTDF